MIRLEGAVAALSGGVRLATPDLTVAAGERLAVMGPSGAGKTTLLLLVAGVVEAASGRVEVDGFAMRGADDAARRAFRLGRIGLVLQDFDLIDYLTVEENIRLPARLAGREGREGAARAAALAQALGLDHALGRRPGLLSQGERQRVAVARALHPRPALLLADEATAALDAANARRAVDLMLAEAAASGATMVCVTHDRAVADRFGRVVTLGDGATP